jgi:hypothetical protein
MGSQIGGLYESVNHGFVFEAVCIVPRAGFEPPSAIRRQKP